MAKIIQVFEFETLTLKSDSKGRCLTTQELDKLYTFNDQGNQKYFTGIRSGIRFKNYVGVIQIGGLTIEILPKADKQTSLEEDFGIWQGALLDMLKVCQHINTHAVSETQLKRKPHSLLEVYFEIFLHEVDQLLRSGLTKQYQRNAANVYALKGRLNFSKNIQQNLIHQERFYTEHQVYDYNHLANQIIWQALVMLETLSFQPNLKDKITRLKARFPPIKAIPIRSTHFAQLTHNRKLAPYAKALQIAQMIILNYSPDIRTGQEHMLTLLFDMNKLWEEYIYQMLQRSKKEGITVHFQNHQKFWEDRPIQPDLVIEYQTNEGNKVFVIDTKWKILDTQNPYPNNNDLKQMYVYNIYWNAQRSMLLYPSSCPSKAHPFGNYLKGREKPALNQCKIGFVNVIDDCTQQLNLKIGDQILDQLLEND